MRTIDDYGTFDDALAGAGAPARGLAYQLRQLVVDVMPEVVEVPWPKMRMGPIPKSGDRMYGTSLT